MNKFPEIIYLDNHVLVCDKPAGMLTQPNDSNDDSLEAWGKAVIKERFQKPGAVFLHALHRIDRPVSGLVLFARTSKALSRLNQAMRNRQMRKHYLALVEGVPAASTGMLEHYLIHAEHHAKIVPKGYPEAKLAKLQYRLVRSCQKTNQSWLEIELETGRYHQIRAQMAQIGHPIIGDIRYGSRHNPVHGGIALQHYQFQFPHPITGEILQLKATNAIDTCLV